MEALGLEDVFIATISLVIAHLSFKSTIYSKRTKYFYEINRKNKEGIDKE